MSVPGLELRSEVQRELENAVAWYVERDPRLAGRLLAELDQVYSRILDNPLLFPVVHRDVRRALLDRFPFGVYFALVDPPIRGSRIDVIAVMNLRQHPDTWRLPDR
jgi:hypothetical protein